jgi:outer membrane receptor protein involved in Fe transport
MSSIANRAVRFLVPISFALALSLTSPDGIFALEGRVLRADGKPAGGHLVSVAGRSLSTACDVEGRFRLDLDPVPPFEVLVVSPDGRVSTPFSFETADTALELRLPERFDETITVVSGVAANLDASPGAATVTVDQDNLRQRLPERLADTLEGVAGASRSEEGLSGVPSLRGMARGRTILLFDGGRLTAERRAGSSGTFLNPFTFGSVEVARGAGSVVYGSDAFGGVIDARPRYPESGPLSLRFDVSATALAGDDLMAGFELSRGIGQGAILIGAHGREADDAEAGGGDEIFNSAYEDRGFSLRWAAPTAWGSLRAGLSSDDSSDLGKPATDSRVTRTYYPEEESRRLNVALQTGPRGVLSNLELSLFAHSYRLVTDRDRLPTPTVTRSIERADNDSDDLTVRAIGEAGVAGGRFQLGLDATSRFALQAVVENISFDLAGNQTRLVRTVAIDDGERTDTALFATWERPLASRWSLAVGARGDEVRSKTAGGVFGSRSVDDGTFSGQIAISAGPFADTVATLQLARGFRVPTLSDRFFVGPSGRGIANGNPDLEPEKSMQVDAAVRWARSGRSVVFSAYRYDIDDLIERFRVGNDFFFRNRGEARVEGAELEGQFSLGDEFGIEAAATYARGETPSDGLPVADIPATNVNTTLRWSRERFYAFARAFVFLEDDRPGPSELTRPSYETIDLGGGYRFYGDLELRLLLRNATDERYRESADSVADFNRGRTLSLGLLGKI